MDRCGPANTQRLVVPDADRIVGDEDLPGLPEPPLVDDVQHPESVEVVDLPHGRALV